MLDLEDVRSFRGSDLEWDLRPSPAPVVDDQLQALGVGALDLFRLGAGDGEVANRLADRAIEPLKPRAEPP